jgi:hypothetical protein
MSGSSPTDALSSMFGSQGLMGGEGILGGLAHYINPTLGKVYDYANKAAGAALAGFGGPAGASGGPAGAGGFLQPGAGGAPSLANIGTAMAGNPALAGITTGAGGSPNMVSSVSPPMPAAAADPATGMAGPATTSAPPSTAPSLNSMLSGLGPVGKSYMDYITQMKLLKQKQKTDYAAPHSSLPGQTSPLSLQPPTPFSIPNQF